MAKLPVTQLYLCMPDFPSPFTSPVTLFALHIEGQNFTSPSNVFKELYTETNNLMDYLIGKVWIISARVTKFIAKAREVRTR